jgi:hypothetical protein
MRFDDSYVVRIFRREPRAGEMRRTHDAVALTGVIEHPGTGQRLSFHDIEELWATLAQIPPSTDSAKGKPRA